MRFSYEVLSPYEALLGGFDLFAFLREIPRPLAQLHNSLTSSTLLHFTPITSIRLSSFAIQIPLKCMDTVSEFVPKSLWMTRMHRAPRVTHVCICSGCMPSINIWPVAIWVFFIHIVNWSEWTKSIGLIDQTWSISNFLPSCCCLLVMVYDRTISIWYDVDSTM